MNENEFDVLGPMQRHWCNELRSGNYPQGAYRLYNPSYNSYCCLGVACRIFNLKETSSLYLDETHNVIGLYNSVGGFYCTKKKAYVRINCFGRSYINLSHMNDSGVPFTYIADTIATYHFMLFHTRV